MDNFELNIVAQSQDSLRLAMGIVLGEDHRSPVIRSYQLVEFRKTEKPWEPNVPSDVVGKTGLVFLFLKQEKVVENGPVNLPFMLDAEGAVDFASRWLKEQDYGQTPGHDGSVRKGWRLFTLRHGGYIGLDSAVCAIVPIWACYGK